MSRKTFLAYALLVVAAVSSSRAAPLGPTPVGSPPAGDFAWRHLPGIGWGWVQAGIGEALPAPAPAVLQNAPKITGRFTVAPQRCYTDPRTDQRVCPR